MHDITNIEVARRKAKAVEAKFDKSYLQQKETQCRYCGDNWSPGHKCNNYKSDGHQTDKELDISTNSYDSDRKKKKNTCRRCGEKWIPGHKCLSTQTSH